MAPVWQHLSRSSCLASSLAAMLNMRNPTMAHTETVAIILDIMRRMAPHTDPGYYQIPQVPAVPRAPPQAPVAIQVQPACPPAPAARAPPPNRQVPVAAAAHAVPTPPQVPQGPLLAIQTPPGNCNGVTIMDGGAVPPPPTATKYWMGQKGMWELLLTCPHRQMCLWVRGIMMRARGRIGVPGTGVIMPCR